MKSKFLYQDVDVVSLADNECVMCYYLVDVVTKFYKGATSEQSCYQTDAHLWDANSRQVVTSYWQLKVGKRGQKKDL